MCLIVPAARLVRACVPPELRVEDRPRWRRIKTVEHPACISLSATALSSSISFATPVPTARGEPDMVRIVLPRFKSLLRRGFVFVAPGFGNRAPEHIPRIDCAP